MNTQPASSTPEPNPPAAIGVLDSGVGGLSVLREIHRRLPGIPTLYYADQKHLPYGPRPAAEIRAFVGHAAEFLIGQGAVMIVLACHSASAAALQSLRAVHPAMSIVGIEPAVKPAAEATRSGVISVLTTQATADGALYQSVVARFARDVQVITRVSPALVELVEQGSQDTPQGEAVLREHIAPLVEAGADQIVLACTHFPFLKANIERITDVALVDPGAAVARQVARVLPEVRAWQGEHRYFTSGEAARFQEMLVRLTGVDAPVEGV